MSFWDQVRKKGSDAAAMAEKQAAIAKLNMEMNGVRGNLGKKQQELGQRAVQLFRDGNIFHSSLEPLVGEVATLEEKLAGLEKQVADLRDGSSSS